MIFLPPDMRARPFGTKSLAADQHKLQTLIPEHWNKRYTYSFVVQGDDSNDLSGILPNFKTHRVNLLLAPSSIAISTPFAISTVATSGGISEEHNGIVFRTISISGTTGVFPPRQTDLTNGQQKDTLNIVSQIFPSTAAGIRNVISAAKRSSQAVTGKRSDDKYPEYGDGDTNNLDGTGYYQFWALHHFLVAYAELKKSVNARKLRLVFQSPKDNVGYVCTPMSFDMTRDAANPLLYRYRIVLKAWDLLTDNIEVTPVAVANLPRPSNPAAIKAILTTLSEFRNTVTSASNVLLALNADLVNVMNVFNQSYLLLKDIAGIPKSFADFANTLASNADTMIGTSVSDSVVSTLNNASQSGDTNARAVLGDAYAGSFTDVGGTAAANSAALTQVIPTGETITSLSGSSQAPAFNQGLKSALQFALDTPELSDKMSVDDVSLPDSVQQAINAQIDSAKTLTSQDVRKLTANLQSLSDKLAYATNSIDVVYTRTYGLPTPLNDGRTLTEDDIILQASLQDAKMALLATLATGELFKERELDPFTIANQNLEALDQLDAPLSSYPAIVEKATTLERMALKYLGDANRAREIALLNGLRAPYIDEVGFTLAMTAVSGRSCLVTDISNLAIGQYVTLGATNKASTKRRILNIENLGSGTYRLTFDGNSDLDSFGYTPATTPIITARLPGCVGGGDVVLIPNPEEPPGNPERPSSLTQALSAAERIFKVDLAIGKNGDLQIDKNGDFALSYGYTNAVQAIRTKIEVEQGELEQAPLFGIPISIGARASDTPSYALKETFKNQIMADNRFIGVKIAIGVSGSVASITLAAEGAGGVGIIPVTFQVGVTE